VSAAPRPGLVAALAFAGGAAVFALAAAPVPFHDKGEPREALTVRAVLDGHGFALPRRDGVEMPSKPPLYHWLAALALEAGVRPEELALRLPSVLLGAGTVALAAGVGAAAYGAAAGVVSAAVLATAFEHLRAATQARVDMTLAFFIVAATLAWQAGVTRPEGRAFVRLGWLSAAAAVLAKGPVGLVLPFLVVGADALAAREPRRLRRHADAPGMALGGALVLGWLAAAWQSGGTAFLARQLLHENLERALGGDEAPHAHSVFYYGPVLLGSLFPWTLALPAALGRLRRRGIGGDRFLLVWIATVLVFYSLASGKRSVYMLPLLPPLAVLTGAGLVDWLARPVAPAARLALGVGTGLLAVLALAIAGGAHRVLGAAVAPLLSPSDRANLPLVLGTLEESRAGLALALGALAVLVPALGRRKPGGGGRAGVLAVVAVGAVFALGLARFGTRPLALAATPRPFAARVVAALGPGDDLCASGWVDYGVRWYLARPLRPCPKEPAAVGRRTLVLREVGQPAPAGCAPSGVLDERPPVRTMRFALDECPAGRGEGSR
jgi:4-amino-4-deoxy-L-arabinose transferase-like glycosyltransferase